MHVLKPIIISFLGAAIALVWWYGTYLPLKKAALTAAAPEALARAETPGEFQDIIDRAIGFPSPSGQSEQAEVLSNAMLSMVNRGIQEDAARTLVTHYEKKIIPVLGSKPNGGYARNFFLLGQMRAALWFAHRNNVDLDTAIRHFERGIVAAPRRTEFLERLLILYTASSREEDAERMVSMIKEIAAIVSRQSLKFP